MHDGSFIKCKMTKTFHRKKLMLRERKWGREEEGTTQSCRAKKESQRKTSQLYINTVLLEMPKQTKLDLKAHIFSFKDSTNFIRPLTEITFE